MIVVDVNVIAYLLIPGRYTASAEALLESDPVWAVPRLWRSELRNILATYVRTQKMALQDALALFQRASEIIDTEEYEVDTASVLRLSEASRCSAYDCEYVALADFLDVDFVTADKKLANAFPRRARLLLEV
ncbi:type II toxin-antitoxin system VapC family toxin [Tepidimonas taiwanensis]|uniref:Ribonuclease VapC n=1 Tax=Tepidimonas taiwanensis TaxID=307486 RepID=A0A554WZN8_9BURK|nr:type II toxin-antitoxin system VapC family toxin [Tepidimonas taiwanensis]MCX7692257.1 type II toxin-antitoxin system VapC family toxin [Tepidimonas taiwanensis]MDM7463101.1 type II toxin-antitoxin system VapC family toxin [Tepidimonas taiwanensis]TSE29053.1 tRNA(fMet)-specific endonuclease VapC [Tepidimonas taiwanensis]UBQ05694.1 type II toxin-antitoxin system VapC family toxin [Tepidimonas taiwanensis]